MKRVAFPALFTLVLFGFWVFSRAQGGSAPTSTTPQQQVAKPDELTEKEELFAATLTPKNQKVFTEMMDKRERTMAMEMVIENNRSGGTLDANQAVEIVGKDHYVEETPGAPVSPTTPPSSPSTTPGTPGTPASPTGPKTPPPSKGTPASPSAPSATPAPAMPTTPKKSTSP